MNLYRIDSPNHPFGFGMRNRQHLAIADARRRAAAENEVVTITTIGQRTLRPVHTHNVHPDGRVTRAGK